MIYLLALRDPFSLVNLIPNDTGLTVPVFPLVTQTGNTALKQKINAAKSVFCSFETEYLGYTLTKKSIKTQTNTIDLILALKPPTKVKELRTFLGMEQYFQDMCRSRSDMLTPLTDLAGECGTAKVTKAN